MAFLRKYGTGTGADVWVPIVKRGVVDFAVSADWTPSAGDVKITIDGAAAASIGTLPTALTMGNTALWKFVFADAELQGKVIVVTVADSATKAIEDQSFVVETYGHASAKFIADLSLANLPANVTQYNGSNATSSGGRPEVNTTHAAGTAWGSGAITAASIAADAITAAKIADGAIDAATFAAGAINAAAIASDAITDAKVASDVTIASVTGAVGSVTGAVGSVTGNVGGNVAGSVGSIATGGIAAASFAAGAIDAAAIAANAIGASELATDAVSEIAAAVEAAILDEGDATALLAAIAAKVEEFLINDGDSSATLAAIATAVRTNLATELGRIDAAITTRGSAAELAKVPKSDSNVTWNATALASVNAEVDAALADYDGPTNAEMVARTLAAASYATAAAQTTAQTSIDDLPTNAELTTALAAADDATLAAIAALSIPTTAQIADKFLGRNIAGGSDGGRTVSQALYVLRNKVDHVIGNVYGVDDTSVAWSFTVTTDGAAEPITIFDPS